MAEQKIGDLLDSLNTTLDLDSGDMVTDIIVIAKVVSAKGGVSIGIGQSESTTWLDELGLVHGALGIIQQNRFTQDGDD